MQKKGEILYAPGDLLKELTFSIVRHFPVSKIIQWSLDSERCEGRLNLHFFKMRHVAVRGEQLAGLLAPVIKRV